MSRWLPLALLLAGCGVDGVPLHPDGRPAAAMESDREAIVSPSAGWQDRR